MDFTNHTSADFISLIEKISAIFNEKGLKATTMDLVAQRLQMSKRTLYEIFENKNEMILEVMRFNQKQHSKYCESVFNRTNNVMEGMLAVFKAQQRQMKRVNVEFFRDLDSYYRELRPNYEAQGKFLNEQVAKLLNKGVEQGVFRENVNYPVSLALMRLQMESLKRMEENFPPEITLQEAFDSICIGFLRSIASLKGIKIIDETLSNESYFNNFMTGNPAASPEEEE